MTEDEKCVIVRVGTFNAKGEPVGWKFRRRGLEHGRGRRLPKWGGYTLEELRATAAARGGAVKRA